jgi:hypothetical protein
MIELTERQGQELENPEAVPPRIVNPWTAETFVVLRVDEYQRLEEDEYDDSPWAKGELQALAWEAGRQMGWEDMDEYDDVPEVPGTGATCPDLRAVHPKTKDGPILHFADGWEPHWTSTEVGGQP